MAENGHYFMYPKVIEVTPPRLLQEKDNFADNLPVGWLAQLKLVEEPEDGVQ